MKNFIYVTKIVDDYNKEHKSNKVLAEFFSNKATNNAVVHICANRGIERCYYSVRGKNGGTWFHPDLVVYLNNWLYKLPNKTFTRDEVEFTTIIQETFKNILIFKKQYAFNNYFVDLYCEELNLCIEFDELHHLKDKQKYNDNFRQKEIEFEFNVVFIRHNIKDNTYITINKIINIYKNKLCKN